MYAPFVVCVYGSIVHPILVLRKCAILIFVPSLRVERDGGYFAQKAFRRVARRLAEGVHGLPRVEVGGKPEVLAVKISVRVNAAAREQHVRHAGLKRRAVFGFDVKLVEFFEKAVFAEIHEVGEIIREIVRYRVFRRRYERGGKRGFVLEIAERVL